MKKLTVHRLVEVWVVDNYEVEEINEETIQDAVNYEIDCSESDTLWETLIDKGPYEVYDEQGHLLEKHD